MLRSHAAGSLRSADAGQKVTLAGWVARRRDHGGVIFIDLRDASGVSQVVFREADVLAHAHRLRAEFCIAVDGVVEIRPEGNANPEIPTGEIEVNATSLTVLGESAPLPFQLDEQAGEEARLKYRYLDLRRDWPGQRDSLAFQGECGRARRAGAPRLRRDRDADDDPLDTGGRARLPGAGPAAAGQLLRAAAEPAAVQAAADGGGHGALLPDRPLLSRRGFPRRPPARVHPARHGDELRRLRGRHRDLRGDHRGAVAVDRLRRAVAVAADDLRGRDAPLRLRQARPAVRPRARRVHGVLLRHAIPGVPGALRRRRRHARRRVAAAAHAGRLAGVRQAARAPRAGLRARRRRRDARRPGRQEPVRRRTRRAWPRTSAPSRATASSSPRARPSRRERCWARSASRSPSAWT